VNITCTSGDTGDIHVRNTELFTNAIDEAITNAIKHTEQPIPEVAITVQRDLGADQFRITIADNGPGVPELERHAINSGEETPLGQSWDWVVGDEVDYNDARWRVDNYG